MIKFEIMKSLTFKRLMDHKRWAFHLAVLLLAVVIIVFLLVTGQKITGKEASGLVLLLFVQLEVFFLFARMIFRELNPGISVGLLTRTVLLRFLVFMILCFFSALLINILFIGIVGFILQNDPAGSIKIFISRDFHGWARSTMGGLMFGAAIFIFVQWQDALRREQKLREENLIFQNQTLRNQVNPHFLFNSLNTLSGLIPEHPDSAERFILKLSSIYRYILENSSKETVPLKAELDFISDYYYLHAIRDDGKILLTIDAPGAEKFRILPVSLQILVENAIKHNVATRANPLLISMQIIDEIMTIRNNVQKMNLKVKSTGIGLNNLKERLRLATGKSLEVEETESEFIVKLPLII